LKRDSNGEKPQGKTQNLEKNRIETESESRIDITNIQWNPWKKSGFDGKSIESKFIELIINEIEIRFVTE
jgi:hypothetical protein